MHFPLNDKSKSLYIKDFPLINMADSHNSVLLDFYHGRWHITTDHFKSKSSTFDTHCWVYVMSIRHTQEMKLKCHISHIF